MSNKNKGFSLIELLLAITILSIVMIMVTQFMGTSSVALTKTKKNLNIQTEALEVGSKISDTLMQATYIRVCTQDGKTYNIDMTLDTSKKRQLRDVTETTESISQNLVVDNYPNYLLTGTTNRKIIVKENDYTLLKEDGSPYPSAVDEDDTAVRSFRLLSKSGIGGKLLYVKPQYIYARYQRKESGTSEEAYMLLYFKDDKIYIDRNTISYLESKRVGYNLKMADGYKTAVKVMESKLASSTEAGLLTEHILDAYFSADTEANTIYLNMMFEDSKYKGYNYNYNEALLLRNSNVLTVEPEKLFKKE